MAGSCAANVRHLFGLCKDFDGKVWNWRWFLTDVGCFEMQNAASANQSWSSTNHIGRFGGWRIGCNFAAFLSFAPEINKLTEDLALGLMIDKPPVSYVN